MKKLTLLFTLLLLTALSYTAKAAESRTAVCTAGNLATVAASYLTTVTNLTVTGTIDARDFKTMRDNMPLLEVIDLSGATVAAYSGTGGTGETSSGSYSANVIPTCAFCNPSSFNGKTSLKQFIYPAIVKSIGKYAFYSCSGLKGSLIIPESITSIGEAAFDNCTGFTGTLVIPASIKTIGRCAFQRCNGFTGSLTIPTSVTDIGVGAFCVCKGLTDLTIPASVKNIGEYAFSGCSGLTSIYAYSFTPININTSPVVFGNVNKGTCILHVPIGTKSLYETAIQWKDFTNIVDDIVITSIEEVQDSKTISIYPNPAIWFITISGLGNLVGDKTVTLLVVDVSGTILETKEIEANINAVTVDVSSFKNGIYFIKVQTSNGSVVKRFVKE